MTTVTLNVDEVGPFLESFASRVEQALDVSLMRAGFVIEGLAKEKCPVDTGRLRSSVTTATDRAEGNGVHSVTVGTNVEYAPYIEYGTGIYAENGNGRKTPWRWVGDSVKWKGGHTTRGSHAYPFLRPALAEGRDDAVEEFAASIAEELQK